MSTTQTSGLPITPDFVMQGLRTVAGQGAANAFGQYQGYSGPRIAGLTPDQENAQAMARNVAAGTVSDPNLVQQNIQYGMSGYNPTEVTNKYMSPYTTGVVNEIARLGNQNLMNSGLPGVNSTFVGAGQFGSTRNAEFTNRAIQDQNYNILGQQSKALASAYDTANQNYQSWHQNALTNASTATNLQGTGLNALNAAGQQDQNQTQQSYDLAYNDFKNQRDWGQQQLGWYNDLLQGSNTPSGTASPTWDNTQNPSPWTSGLSTAANIYGTFSKLGV